LAQGVLGVKTGVAGPGRNPEGVLATRNPEVVTGVPGENPERTVLKLAPDEYLGGQNACVELSLSGFETSEYSLELGIQTKRDCEHGEQSGPFKLE
jgi:hypothetical protein